MAGTGAFHGAGVKAAEPRCGGGLVTDPTCPGVLQDTVHAAMGTPALAVLSPAAARLP